MTGAKMRNLARAAIAAALLLGTTAGCKWAWPPWQTKWQPSLVNSHAIPVHEDCVRHNQQVDVVHIVVPNVDPIDLESATLSHYKSDSQGNAQQGSVVA